MLRMALRTLRFRKGGFIATFVAMFFGALIVMACGGLMETGIRTAVPPQRLAAAPIVVTGQQSFVLPKEEKDDKHMRSALLPERVRLESGLVGKVASVPGVADAVGDISFTATITGQKPAVGHSWDSAALAPYTLVSGAAPSLPGDVVLDAAVAGSVKVGDEVDITADGNIGPHRVSGIAAAPHAFTQTAVFFSQPDAESLSGHPGLVDSIGVLAAPGTDIGALQTRVTDALSGAPTVVLTGDDRGAAEFPEALQSGENLIVLSAVSGGLALMVAMFVIASTLGLSVQQRQRELALLRAISSTPRQIRRMVVGEAMVVSVLATGLAGVLGSMLGRWLFTQLVAHGVVPPVVAFREGWIPVVAAAGGATLAALLAALAAAHRAARVKPTEALAESAVAGGHWLTKTRLITAILCFGGGTALAIVTVAVMTGPIAASTAGPSVILWAVGLAALSPGVTNVMTAILQWPLRALSGVNGHLALLNVRATGNRVAAAITPIMLATGVATANIYLQTTQDALASQAFSQDLRADAVISSASGGLSPDLLGQVQRLPGVAGASELVQSRAFVIAPYDSSDDKGLAVSGVSASGISQTNAVKVTGGSLTALDGDTVALPDTLAADLGRHVGDTITLRLGDGTTDDVRVVATFGNQPGFETLMLPARLVAAHTTAGLVPQLLVRAAPGTDAAQLTASLRSLTSSRPDVRVGDRGTLIAAHQESQDIGAWVQYLMVGMIMAYTVISVVNTLVMGTARRRREFGLQRLTGATRSQVMRMMGMEGLVVALVGLVLGTVVAAGAIVPFSLVASHSLLPTGPLWIYLSVIGVIGVLALSASLVPAWLTTRARPADAAMSGE